MSIGLQKATNATKVQQKITDFLTCNCSHHHSSLDSSFELEATVDRENKKSGEIALSAFKSEEQNVQDLHAFHLQPVREAWDDIINRGMQFNFCQFAIIWDEEFPEQLLPIYIKEHRPPAPDSYVHPFSLTSKSSPLKKATMMSPLKVHSTPIKDSPGSFQKMMAFKKRFHLTTGRNVCIVYFKYQDRSFGIFASTSGLPGGPHAEMKALAAIPAEVLTSDIVTTVNENSSPNNDERPSAWKTLTPPRFSDLDFDTLPSTTSCSSYPSFPGPAVDSFSFLKKRCDDSQSTIGVTDRDSQSFSSDSQNIEYLLPDSSILSSNSQSLLGDDDDDLMTSKASYIDENSQMTTSSNASQQTYRTKRNFSYRRAEEAAILREGKVTILTERAPCQEGGSGQRNCSGKIKALFAGASYDLEIRACVAHPSNDDERQKISSDYCKDQIKAGILQSNSKQSRAALKKSKSIPKNLDVNRDITNLGDLTDITAREIFKKSSFVFSQFENDENS